MTRTLSSVPRVWFSLKEIAVLLFLPQEVTGFESSFCGKIISSADPGQLLFFLPLVLTDKLTQQL
jgi:hypothetical protein